MTPQLTDDKLLLRPPLPSDAEQLYEAARESIGEVGRWLPWCHAGYVREESEAWIATCQKAWQEEESYPFFIFDRATKQLLGGTGINEIDKLRRRANLGYWIRTSRMGHGAATAAARLVARFGFERLGMQRIEIVAAVGNVASQRVAEKVGAVREGLARNRLRIKDVPTDAFEFSLIPSDMDRWPRP
jgi:RimJ/RimL family protein N-acetyltransferase